MGGVERGVFYIHADNRWIVLGSFTGLHIQRWLGAVPVPSRETPAFLSLLGPNTHRPLIQTWLLHLQTQKPALANLGKMEIY